jgi:hypothetical protein
MLVDAALGVICCISGYKKKDEILLERPQKA